MNDTQWLAEYFERYRASIFAPDVFPKLMELKKLLVDVRTNGRKIIMAGNGGSAAIASHCAVDFTKCARVRCVNFNEADLITCFANDYGYEQWLEKALEFYADEGDVVILISSSGKSANMVKAAQYVRKRALKLVTFTGFSSDNPLKALGDLNIWVNSEVYNIVEMTHQIWLLAVCDWIVAVTEGSAAE